MLNSRSLLLAAMLLTLVACGGGENSVSEENLSPAPTDPSPVEGDAVLSNSRVTGTWITSHGCRFDTGRLLITQMESNEFVLSLLASGGEGLSTVSLYPTEIGDGEYNSDGAVVYRYSAQTSSPGFLYFAPFMIGTIALSVDGGTLFMTSVCARDVDLNMMYTPEDADQSIHGARFTESARLIRDQIFLEYEEARKALIFDLSDRGRLDGGLADKEFAKLRAWYLESIKQNLGILIGQYAVINLERVYVTSTLEILKGEDMAQFPNNQGEVEAMYDELMLQ